jgi:hypothetical protein
MATSKGLLASEMTFSRRRERNAARMVVTPSSQTLGSSGVIGLKVETGMAPMPLIMIEAGGIAPGARTCLTGSSSLTEPWMIVRLLSIVVAGTL